MRRALLVSQTTFFVGTVIVLATELNRAQELAAPEELFLTVAREGPAIVRDVRHATLVAGVNDLRLYELSPRVKPETVHVRTPTSPSDVQILEQQLWFEALNPERALQSLVGRDVRLIRQHPTKEELIQGRLLLPPSVAGPEGEIPMRLFVETPAGEIRVLNRTELILDAIPEGDFGRVRLDWKLQVSRPDRYRIELMYLSDGLSYQPQYILRLSAAGNRGDFLGWATVQNDTGMTFSNVNLQLSDPDSFPAAGVAPSTLALYSQTRPITLETGRSRQVTIVQGADLALQTQLTLAIPEVSNQPPKFTLPLVRRLEFENREAAGLGHAFPGGPFHVYQLDEKNHPHIAASGTLSSSLPGQTVSLMAQPFPGLLGHVRVSPGQDGSKTIRISIDNAQAEAHTVEVFQALGIDDAVQPQDVVADLSVPTRARFRVEIPSQSSATLRYEMVAK